MLFRILVFANVKISYYSNNRKLAAAPGEQVGNERFWGYFWGYSVIDCTTIPIKINRLRHLFDCLLNNPSCAACWQWYVQQRQRVTGAITGNRVGRKLTRQGAWTSLLAGMFAVSKSPPGLACIADRYLRILARDGRAARERVKPESDKTVNAGEYP